ncbi:MAG: Dyp-type peroxidase [Thermoanaerobaculia bacterium]
MPNEPLLEADDLQGNGLRGFDTNCLDLLGLKIDDAAAARAWLRALAPDIASLAHVHDYRRRRSANDPRTSVEVLVNVALSRYALDALEFDFRAIGDGLFNVAMGRLAGVFGDLASDYVIGQDKAHTPDVLLLAGSQDANALTAASDALVAGAAGLRLIYRERGEMLAGEVEHFGFRDGLSQVAARGVMPDGTPLNLRSMHPDDPFASTFARPGQPLVWPGQFVFGYATQTDDPLIEGPVFGAPWMRNGSLVVFRRLEQDVPAFRAFLRDEAAKRGVSARELGAQVVGRWEDGTPVSLRPNGPDAMLASDVLANNHFAFDGAPAVRVMDGAVERTIPADPADERGLRCPLFSHVRKVNPRNLPTDQGSGHHTLTTQMIRRGIPFGPRFGIGRDDEKRGLLFLAYQTSFTRQFKVLNNLWMNNPAAPERDGEGHDLLVGQDPAGGERFGTYLDAQGNETGRIATLARFVIATGGAFLFSPSRSFFAAL